jgi:hypothetical protein
VAKLGGAGSRRKGHAFERAIAIAFRDLFPGSRRGLQYRDPRECDVEGTPFRIEAKRLRKVTLADIKNALKQVRQDASKWEDDRPCIVITKADREDALVTLSLDDLLRILDGNLED